MKTYCVEDLLQVKVINPAFTVRNSDIKRAEKAMKNMLSARKLHYIKTDKVFYSALQYQRAYENLSTAEAYNLKSLCY